MCDILLVEDNERFRQTLQDSLSEHLDGADVRSAKSGEEAVKRMQKNVPHVLFLDIGLPGMNGLEVVERIRPRSETMHIVMITGNDSPEYREAAGKMGADYFVSKNTARLEEILSLAGELLGAAGAHAGASEKFRLPKFPLHPRWKPQTR
jgi:CheY-like chemotaxis protein